MSISARTCITVLVSLVLILGGIGWIGGPANLIARFAVIPIWIPAVMLAMLAANLLVVVFRFARMLHHFGLPVSFLNAARASIAGYLGALVVISLFGQVAGRQVVMQRMGIPTVVNAAIAAYERAILAVVSGVMAVVGAIYLLGGEEVLSFLARLPVMEIIVVICVSSTLSYTTGASKMERHLSNQMLTWQSLVNLLEVMVLTVFGQLLLLACFVIPLLSLAADVDWRTALAAAAVVSFAASLPISVSGWGVREIAAVYVFGRMGIHDGDALTVSVLVGLLSTLIILLAVPVLSGEQLVERKAKMPSLLVVDSCLEVGAAWLLGICTATLVFFQFHASLPGGKINVNLADPFAILSLAALTLHCLATRRGPEWRLSGVNTALLVMSTILIFGFVRGWLDIGFTQWAFAGRLLGWLVLIGYLAAGYMIVADVGKHGLRRLAEVVIMTTAVIVTYQAFVRTAHSMGLEMGNTLMLTPNFDGFAGNRNAFSLQILTAMSLLLAYFPVYRRRNHSGRRFPTYLLALGILLAGLAWTASRSALAVATMLGIYYWARHPKERKSVVAALVTAFVIWSAPNLLIGQSANKNDNRRSISIQSAWSTEKSDHTRGEILIRALEMWCESPIVGVGLGVFISRSEDWFHSPQVIHSTPLWILTEFGVIGELAFGGIFLLLLRSEWRTRRNLPYSEATLLVFILVGMFSIMHEIMFQRVLWFTAGALLARSFNIRSGEKVTLTI